MPATIRLTPALILPAIWGLGAGLFLLHHMLAYILTYRKLWRWSTRVTDNHLLRRFAKIKNDLSIKHHVKLRWSAKAASPLLIGFLRPCIILPYTPLDSVQLDFMLYHELTHLKRGDLWVKLAALLANAVHWFNPLVWMLSSRVGFDTELACNADVLAGTGRDIRKAYGYTVLAFIEQGWRCRTPLTSRFLGGKKQMKQRFRNITDMSAKRRGVVVLFAIVLIIALAGSAVYAAEGVPLPTKYPDFNYALYNAATTGDGSPEEGLLSIEEAAELSAEYIYDIFGESIDGHAVWMSYMPSRKQWGGRVTEAESKLERGAIIFSFIIDAGEGKRIRILDMREPATDLPEKRMTKEEISKLERITSDGRVEYELPPDGLDEYEKLAMEAARKHFYDDEVASLNYHGMQPAIIGTNEADVSWYKETILSFVATDTTGREAEIRIVMETGKLKEIGAHTNDAVLAARKAERERENPGRTVIYGN
jgi:beta-lactamase regulating signal transducer with metallopeptidase domain